MIRMIKALFWSSLSRPWFISKELRPYYERAKATEERIKKKPLRTPRSFAKARPWYFPDDISRY